MVMLYNFADRTFFTQRNFVAEFIRLKLNFIPKCQKSLFEPPFGDSLVTYALHL